MDRDRLEAMPVDKLLVLSQTDKTFDPNEGLDIAELAYQRSETPIQEGTAARQAGFRAEQAGKPDAEVEDWFNKSRAALSSGEAPIKRELLATEILTGRAFSLRLRRLGRKAIELAKLASGAFGRGEKIAKEQHRLGHSWDRFGTMLTAHRATHEAMDGDPKFAARVAVRGIWRAIRTKKEGTPKEHAFFVIKHIGMNAVAGLLAVSKTDKKTTFRAQLRNMVAVKILGKMPLNQPEGKQPSRLSKLRRPFRELRALRLDAKAEQADEECSRILEAGPSSDDKVLNDLREIDMDRLKRRSKRLSRRAARLRA